MPVLTGFPEKLVDAVDEICEADPSVLADPGTIELLHRERARLDAAITRAATEFDAGGEWAVDGARSAAAWLSTRLRIPLGTARRLVHLGRQLRQMPLVEAAWLAGEITEAHVSQLVRVRTPATAELFARDEALLVGHARELRYSHFVRAVAYWEQLANPDGVEDRAAAHQAARRLHLSQTYEARWILDGVLDPIAGSIVADALRRIDDELFEADWAEARERVGPGVSAADLRRTPAQRRADALVEMARRAMAAAPGARMPEPLFTVLVGYETFAGRICELADGTVVTPGSLVPWLPEGWVERVVFDGPDRVINVGARRRIFDGATRRGVEVRDRECFDDWCEERADRCEIDHVQPHAAGGLTVEENGRVACGFHNRRRHRRR